MKTGSGAFEAALGDLERRLPGRVKRRGSDGWESARRVFAVAARMRTPLAVVRPADRDEVAAVLAWASATGIVVSPRSGGHAFDGFSCRDDTVMIDLRSLNRATSRRRRPPRGDAGKHQHGYRRGAGPRRPAAAGRRLSDRGARRTRSPAAASAMPAACSGSPPITWSRRPWRSPTDRWCGRAPPRTPTSSGPAAAAAGRRASSPTWCSKPRRWRGSPPCRSPGRGRPCGMRSAPTAPAWRRPRATLDLKLKIRTTGADRFIDTATPGPPGFEPGLPSVHLDGDYIGPRKRGRGCAGGVAWPRGRHLAATSGSSPSAMPRRRWSRSAYSASRRRRPRGRYGSPATSPPAPVDERGAEAIIAFVDELQNAPGLNGGGVIIEPSGGRTAEVPVDAAAFPHRGTDLLLQWEIFHGLDDAPALAPRHDDLLGRLRAGLAGRTYRRPLRQLCRPPRHAGALVGSEPAAASGDFGDRRSRPCHRIAAQSIARRTVKR